MAKQLSQKSIYLKPTDRLRAQLLPGAYRCMNPCALFGSKEVRGGAYLTDEVG